MSKDLREKWLWLDPLDAPPGGVLLAPIISCYAKKYGLLVGSDFNEDNLKGASYAMSPDSNDGWIVKGKKFVLLETGCEPKSPKRRYYIVPRNSLVYIGIKERLRLPFYMIGRHNLKITYVYQGLLLGTGPQVDPGFLGRLYIPLHNLTNLDVKIYLNESFVSIDFVRTTSLNLTNGVPETIDEFRKKYHLLNPIKREKNNKTLSEYLGDKLPSSSLNFLVEDIEKQSKEFESRQWVDFALVAALVSIFIAVVGICVMVVAIFFAYGLPMEQRVDTLYSNVSNISNVAPEISKLQDTNKQLLEKQKQLNDQIYDLKLDNVELANLKKELDALKAQAQPNNSNPKTPKN